MAKKKKAVGKKKPKPAFSPKPARRGRKGFGPRGDPYPDTPSPS